MKKTKVPSLVTIATLTLITVIFWVFFNVYRVFTKKDPYVVPEEILTPVDPNLDGNILSKLNQRKYLEESTIPDIPAEGITANPPIIIEPTSSLEITELPATPSTSPSPTASSSAAPTQ